MAFKKYGKSTQFESSDGKILDILDINDNIVKISMVDGDKLESVNGLYYKKDLIEIANALKYYERK